MRSVASISIEKSYLDYLKQYIAERWFSSLSEYFIYATKLEQEFIKEDEVLERAQEARNAYNIWETFTWLELLKKISWI